MPAGQLDGGHIARSMLGPKANTLSYTIIILLILMTFYGIPGYGPPYSGWAVYAILIYFLGTSHPPPSEEISSLGSSRMGVGIITGLILLTTFTPSPIFTVDSPFSIEIESDNEIFYPTNESFNFTYITITNNGQSDGWDNLSLSLLYPGNYTVDLVVNYVNISDMGEMNSTSLNFSKYVSFDDSLENLTLNLSSKSYCNLSLSITLNEESSLEQGEVILSVLSRTEEVYTRTFYLNVEGET